MPRRIYVASSWRNQFQQSVVQVLRNHGHQVYDFQHPRTGGPDNAPLDDGFHWSELDPEWKQWDPATYREALTTNPIAALGFDGDFSAMKWADTCVLVLPSGRSAHLEGGYFVDRPGKELHILLQPGREGFEPELMYLMATRIHLSLTQLVDTLASPMRREFAA